MRPVSSKPPRKWTAIQTGRVVTVADIVDDTSRQVSNSVSTTNTGIIGSNINKSPDTSTGPSISSVDYRALEEE